MFYKEDWPEAKKRLEAFWNEREILDRCCVAVFAPRKGSKLPPFPELQWGPWLGGLETLADDDEQGIRAWWTDPEQNYRRMLTWFENTYFGGEAIPCTYVNWGAMAMAAFYGSPPVFKKNTVWYPVVIEDWERWEWKFDKATNAYWQQTLAIVRYLLSQNHGRYFVGTPEFGSAADLLSLMRGMSALSLDLYDNPDAIKKAVSVIATTWVELNEEIHGLTHATNDQGGVLAWMSLWAPGRISQIACDFSTMIAPEMLNEFFVPEIRQEAAWCEYAMYHLDGPEAMRSHLDAILALDEIDAIEWTPGAGKPPTYTPAYMPRYKKAQAAGKRLYLLVSPRDIEPLLSELSPKGLFLCTQTDSEDAARDLLKKVTRWSKK